MLWQLWLPSKALYYQGLLGDTRDGADASQGPTPVGFVFQGSSVCQVTAIGVTVILLYTSRACYNLFILSFSQIKNVHSFDYDWYNVSDQVSGGMTRCCLHGEQVRGWDEVLPQWGAGQGMW